MFAPAWGQALGLQEGLRRTRRGSKEGRCGLLRESPRGRVQLGQGARVHHSQPRRQGRCVSSCLPGSRCPPCGCASPTTLPGCNRGAAAGADPRGTHLRSSPTTNPADKPASKLRDHPSANHRGSNPTADRSMASFLKSLIFLLQAAISLPTPLKDTIYFSHFSASTEINNTGRTQTLYTLFKLCCSHGGRGLCSTQRLRCTCASPQAALPHPVTPGCVPPAGTIRNQAWSQQDWLWGWHGAQSCTPS